MNNKLFIPSCHKFITKKDGTANFQRIYGVLKSAYSTKYPNDTLSSEEVFDFLKLNQIVPHDFPHQDMDFDYQDYAFRLLHNTNVIPYANYVPIPPYTKISMKMKNLYYSLMHSIVGTTLIH